MATMDILNLEESIKEYINEENEEDLDGIVDAFKRGTFLHALSKIEGFRKKHQINKELARTLSLIEAACHSQTGEGKRAAVMIRNMYEESNHQSIDDLILYGNVAFMCDYKLVRKIMSDAVKQIESQESVDKTKAAFAYLVLGEAEEQLEKVVRAIKYYKRGLNYMQEDPDDQNVLFLQFKLGALHSMINETDEAIVHWQKALELANEAQTEIKINCLVSMAKIYGREKKYDKAYSYLKEAIPLLERSSLANKRVHAEAYTEMAFNYFEQTQFDKAVPYYEKAIAIHLKMPNYSAKELGMIYMQYAYSLEHKEKSDKLLAAIHYEKAIEQLEKTNDQELLTGALGETILFFEKIGNKKKKRFYENKFVKMTNDKAQLR
ncbi:tetratricopeptide (TPR) repeat protein [Cytobacillus eiseniae]|uniref:Tetratricopeptide (TPR) repeat protein n=1 Tax=Cytobacillus eiseniae TaxID=762947 RepID=A0ABS4RK69_9BACI|nr:tetratricopeptide repeat protein [Cytobacillus eiseniae]MBP2243288.1 tetratricopeptide (TPR) repeat protein [Cytobacillus eiseniae]